jgi:CBS domain-containing protein
VQARDIMTRPVITFRPDTPIRQAAAVLTAKRITAAPVVNCDDELVGMVSEADLIADRFRHDPGSHLRPPDESEPDTAAAVHAVGQVMTTTVIAMEPVADAADLAQAMVDHNVRSIPIVTGSTVVGIVSRRDLLATLVRADDTIRAEVISRLATYAGDRIRWKVDVHDGYVRVVGDLADEAEARMLHILAQTVPGVTQVEVIRYD